MSYDLKFPSGKIVKRIIESLKNELSSVAFTGDPYRSGNNNIFRTELYNGAPRSMHMGNGSHSNGTESFAHGNTCYASASDSHAEGDSTESAGADSHSEGNSTIALGARSHSEGWKTIAHESQSHAEGNESEAKAASSHAEGVKTKTSGTGSHSEGNGTEASGGAAHSEGTDTVASGTSAHSEGRGTIAAGNYQHVAGKWNIEDPQGTYAEIIGNGTSASKKANARTLDWSGNEWLAGDLTAHDSLGNEHSFSAIINAFAFTLSFNANGGTKTMPNKLGLPKESITVPKNAFTKPSGKVFDKWNTAADGSGVDYAEYDPIVLTEDTILYAQWVNA